MKKTVKSLIFAAVLTLVLALGMALAASAADVLDGTFDKVEGALNWAYLENGGTLEATGNSYKAKTLIIYGSGTSFDYKDKVTDGTTAKNYYPWGSLKDSIYHIVIEAENLTYLPVLRQMTYVKTIVIPKSLTSFVANSFYNLKNCYSITVLGESYTDYPGNVFDFRYITNLNNSALSSVAANVTEDITVLFGENSTNTAANDKQHFFNGSSAKITIYCVKDSDGETHAKLLASISSSKVAADITVVNYPQPVALTPSLVFEGYQVRTKIMLKADGTGNAENGLRTLFYCDRTVKNEGYTLVEYGTILSAKERAEVAVLDENFDVTTNKVIKTVIEKNGEIVGTIQKSDDENKIKFATTIINFAEKNYSSQLFIRGYEIWEDSKGSKNVIYSDSMLDESTVYYPSLADVTINNFAYGIINSDDQDENEILWNVLDTCRMTLTKDESFTGGNAKRVFELKDNVITISEESTDADFIDNDTTIHVFETSNGEVVAIVRGTGKVVRTTEMLNTFGVKADTIVYDHGLTYFGFGDFKNNTYVKYVVYPDTLVGTGTEIFNGANEITAVSKVKTARIDGVIDLSYLSGIGFGGNSRIFAGASTKIKNNVEYIHLPKITSNTAITIANDFTWIPGLKAVWCGNNEMVEGKADFTGTNIIGKSDAFANSGISAENIIWGSAPAAEETPTE